MSATEIQPGHASRKVRGGTVTGACEEGICRFIGIPYAEAPVGLNRFREPQPRAAWPGALDCTRPGPCAPHLIRDFPALDLVPLVGRGSLEGGDYLRLNIWAPESGEKRPVMIWIHGSGFVIGSKDAPVQDGTEFARSG